MTWHYVKHSCYSENPFWSSVVTVSVVSVLEILSVHFESILKIKDFSARIQHLKLLRQYYRKGKAQHSPPPH